MRTTHHGRHSFAQNADHFAHNSPFSAFFTEVVCTLRTTPPRTAASLPANGGNCTNRGATRRRHADRMLLMLQNPHHHPWRHAPSLVHSSLTGAMPPKRVERYRSGVSLPMGRILLEARRRTHASPMAPPTTALPMAPPTTPPLMMPGTEPRPTRCAL